MQGQPGARSSICASPWIAASKATSRFSIPPSPAFSARRSIAAGDPAEAITLLEQAVSRAHLRGLSPFETWCKAALSEALLVAGRLPSARAAAAEALAEARARGLAAGWR